MEASFNLVFQIKNISTKIYQNIANKSSFLRTTVVDRNIKEKIEEIQRNSGNYGGFSLNSFPMIFDTSKQTYNNNQANWIITFTRIKCNKMCMIFNRFIDLTIEWYVGRGWWWRKWCPLIAGCRWPCLPLPTNYTLRFLRFAIIRSLPKYMVSIISDKWICNANPIKS